MDIFSLLALVSVASPSLDAESKLRLEMPHRAPALQLLDAAVALVTEASSSPTVTFQHHPYHSVRRPQADALL